MNNHRLLIICVIFVCLLMVLPAWPQGTTSRIAGMITDQTGAVVAGATVKAKNEGTNTTFTTTSGSSGTYVFDSLQIGTYTVSVECKGFKGFVSRSNVLSIGVPTTVNASLQIGASGEVVEVNGGYDLVQTETSGNFGSVVDSAVLTQLPIVGVRGRSPLDLVATIPGVIYNGANATGGGISVHGSRDRAWNYTLDGIDINESTSGGSNTTPSQTNPDSISEFRVITGGFTPEFGRSSGGQVTMVTKSGTNNFHGTGFWFYQSPFLQANTPQNKANIPPKDRSQFVQNIYGGSVGGPIRKDRDFFFTNAQLLHALNSYLTTRTVFTNSAKQGLFRYVVSPGRNGAYGSTNASVDANGNALSGLNIQTYNIASNDPYKIGLDPAIQKYLGLDPAPNNFTVGDGLNTAGYTFVAPQLEKQVNLTFKFDHVFNPNNTIFARWYQGHQNTEADSVNGGLEAFPGLPAFVNTYRTPRNLAVNWRWNPSARTTNEFVVGLNRFGYEFVNPDPNQASNPPFQFGCPGGISGCTNVMTPLSAYVNNNRYATTYQVVDNFTFIKEAHTLKWGANFRYLREIDHRGSIGALNAYPLVYFDTTDNPVNTTTFNLPSNINSNDLSLLQSSVNALLGRIGQVQQGFVSNHDLSSFQPARSWNIMDHRWPEYDSYVQDSWKIKSNLVLDYGLRWEIRLAPHLANFTGLVPDQSVLFGQTPSDNLKFVPGNFYDSDWNNFGPSLGFVWDPFKNGKTSIRAHYRVSFDRINPFSFSSSVFQGMPGLTYQVTDTVQGQDSAKGVGVRAANWQVPTPPTGLTPQQLTQLPAYGTGTLTVADPNMRSPKVYMWGLSIEREIARNTVVSLTYNGNHGVGLYGGYDANQVNFRDNGFLDAFKSVQNGVDSPLMTQIISADTRRKTGESGLAFVQRLYPSYIQQNNAAGLADQLARRTQSGVPLVVQSGLSPYFFKPYPQVLGGLFVLDTRDYSNYNGLEAQVQRRMSNGLLFQASWTWSKTLDVRSFDPTFTTVATGSSQSAAATPFDFHNPRLNYAPADFDRTHVFQGNWVYELPFGKGKRWGGRWNKLLDEIAGGWQFAGNAIYATGRPITFFSGSNTLGSAVQTPASCTGSCDPYMGHTFFNSTLNQQFYLNMNAVPNFTPTNNCRAFADGNGALCIPAAGEASNIGRNYFRQGINANLNATIAKTFSITEHQSLQARLEMQNVTNSQMYDTFGSQSIQSSVFTRLNQASDGVMNNNARRMQLSLKYTF